MHKESIDFYEKKRLEMIEGLGAQVKTLELMTSDATASVRFVKIEEYYEDLWRNFWRIFFEARDRGRTE